MVASWMSFARSVLVNEIATGLLSLNVPVCHRQIFGATNHWNWKRGKYVVTPVRSAVARLVVKFPVTRARSSACYRVLAAVATVIATVSVLGALTAEPAAATVSIPVIYNYSGSTVTWGPAPENETIEILAAGAAGGSVIAGGVVTAGGSGGAELATVNVAMGDSLTIAVGGEGGSTSTGSLGGAGGSPGSGGDGGLGNLGGRGGGGGGGETTVTDTVSGAEVVAAGGGGAGGVDCILSFMSCTSTYPHLGGEGGAGGSATGTAGVQGQSSPAAPGGLGGGGGITSTGPGAGGASTCGGAGSPGTSGGGGGGHGGTECSSASGGGGGGGGGFYGGGGGAGGGASGSAESGGGGGGGGSSYASVSGATSESDADSGEGYVEIAAPGTLGLPLIGGAITAAEGAGGGPATECACLPTTPVHDPVNAMDGDYYGSTTDLSVPGPGVPLDFTRTYDAVDAQASNGTANSSGLGPGWTDNLAMSVSSAAYMATVTEADGAQVNFDANTLNSWCSSSYNYCPVAPRDIATLNHNSDGTWTFTDNVSSVLTYTFSSAGVLTKIGNADGQSITASAETAGTGACPSSATNCTLWTSNAATPNPTLTEVFTAGELTQAIGFATSGTPPSATFCYYGSSCTSATTGLTGSLYSGTDPGSLTTSYTYDATNSNTALRDDLLTRTDPDGGTLTNVYNSTGQISQQTDPAGGVSTYAYSEAPNVPVGDAPGDSTTVTVTPGTGLPSQVTQYSFSSGELSSTTIDPSGGSSASTNSAIDSPITGQHQTSTDPDGHTSSTTLPNPASPSAYLNAIDPTSRTDALGNQTLYAYTSSNEVWCEVEPAEVVNGVTCPSTEPITAPTPGSKNTIALGVTITYYDSAGHPTYVTDPLGNTTETAYTAAEQPYCQVDADQFTIAGKSCPGSPPTSPPTGTVEGYTTTIYSPAGNVTSVTNPDGATTSYAYTNAAFPDTPTQTTDPQGDVTTFTLDSAGRVITKTETSATSSFSATTISGYDTAGRQFCTIAPLAYAQGHASCPSTAPTTPPSPGTDPWPGAQITIFNGNGQSTYEVNPLGGVSQTAYDGAANVYCTVSPANYASGVTCPAAGASWTAGITLTSYDALGRPVQVTNPLGGITATVYDAAGNVTQTTVESNDSTHAPNVVTQYSYDADNNVTVTTLDPSDGTNTQTTEQTYDPNGNAFCSVSANAYAQGTSAYHCPVWQSSWIGAPPSPTSLYSTTPTSAQANNVTTVFYDPNGNELESTDPDVHATVSVDDPDGRTYCSADPTNLATWLSAHPTGTYPYLCPSTPPSSPPAPGSNPGYSTTIFDAMGNTLSSTDQLGDTTSYTFNAPGQTLTTTDPNGKVTTDCYYYENSSGQCASAAPSNGGMDSDLYTTTTPVTTADPSGEVTTTTYEPGGSTLTSTTPAGTTTDAYDAAGDPTSMSDSNTGSGYGVPSTVSYTFNSDGTRHTMTDGTGTTTYSYDDNGDVTSKALIANPGLSNTTTSYGYFNTGVLSSVTYPAYGTYASPQVSYAYDATGAMTSETDWLGNKVTFAHDADSNATGQANDVSTSIPSGTSSSAFSYDGADENTGAVSTLAQTCGGNETLTQSFSPSGSPRNPDGQLSEYTAGYTSSCSGQGSIQRNYSYDLAGRVVYQGRTAQGANPNTFAYDAAGDPTTISSHDAGGSFDTYTQTYDSAGEVTGQTPVSGSGGVASTYTYDTLGDQSSMASAPGTTTYGYSQNAQMTSATSPAGASSYLYDGNGLEAATTTTGSVWGAVKSVDGTKSINGVSCPTSTWCAAVDGSGRALTYNGTTWSSGSSIDGTTVLNAVSCPSTSFCAAVDNTGHALTYNGTSWSSAADIDGTTPLNALSCASTNFCVAVDNTGHALTYNGSTWSSASDIDGSVSMRGVSCPTPSFCAAVDNAGHALVESSGTWSSAVNVDTTTLHAVSCADSSFCVAVDTSGYALHFNGSSWTSPALVDSGHNISSISCPNYASCQAVDHSGHALSYNGTTWSAVSDIDGSNALNAVSCSAANTCVAADASGNALAYQAPAWSSVSDVDGTTSINGTSCPTSTWCVAVDGSGHALTYNGTTWSSASTIDGTTMLNAVSCPSTSVCVAVDNTGHALTYNGTTWSSATDIDGTTPLNAVSCPSTSFCVAVDNTGHALTYNGTSWSSVADIDGSASLKGVSCPGSSFCAAVDSSGNAVTYASGSWSSPSNVDPSRMLRAVSCPDTVFCQAVDTSGHVLTYNGSAWSAAVLIDSGGHTIDSVSCPTAMSCQAVDKVGNQLSYNGTTWTSADVDGTKVINSVSCAAAGFCAAVDASGNALSYSAPAMLAQLTWNTNPGLPLILSDSSNDYLYGPSGTPVEQIALSTSTPTYLTYSASSSAWLATNAAGDEIGYWGYDAFGNLAFGTPASAFGYSGQYSDATTQLVNDRARWYEAQTGGFSSRDPAYAQTDTAYTYAGSDPVNQSDPTGEASTQDFWAAICGGLFDEIPYITALCGLFPGGISLPSVGPNPSAPLPGDENRGAIQIQGSSGSPKNNKGSPFDYSEPWSQGNPPTLDYGVILLDRLIAKTPEKIVKQRTYALAQALDYMVRCSQHFGCYPPGKPRGWYDPGNHPSQRVDIPIFDGTAFINDEGVQLTSLSSQGSLLCEGREVVT